MRQAARRAASRAICTAGNSKAIRTPMIATLTSNSTKVTPSRLPADLTVTIFHLRAALCRIRDPHNTPVVARLAFRGLAFVCVFGILIFRVVVTFDSWVPHSC